MGDVRFLCVTAVQCGKTEQIGTFLQTIDLWKPEKRLTKRNRFVFGDEKSSFLWKREIKNVSDKSWRRTIFFYGRSRK